MSLNGLVFFFGFWFFFCAFAIFFLLFVFGFLANCSVPCAGRYVFSAFYLNHIFHKLDAYHSVSMYHTCKYKENNQILKQIHCNFHIKIYVLLARTRKRERGKKTTLHDTIPTIWTTNTDCIWLARLAFITQRYHMNIWIKNEQRIKTRARHSSLYW